MKQRQKAKNRLQAVLAERHSNVESEAERLEYLELIAKKLNRGYYYAPDEPEPYVRSAYLCYGTFIYNFTERFTSTTNSCNIKKI